MTQTNESLIEALSWRYATKKFDPTKRIPEATWDTLKNAARLTPSSYGLEPYRLIEVRDVKKREALRAVAWNQAQVVDASHFVVFAIETPFGLPQVDALIQRVVRARGVTTESLVGYRDAMIGDLVNGPRSEKIRTWASNQAYIVLGNLMAAAAQLGVDSCPLEGIDPVKFDEILGLEKLGLATVCALPMGYRSAEDKYASLAKVRKTIDELFLVA